MAINAVSFWTLSPQPFGSDILFFYTGEEQFSFISDQLPDTF